MLVNHRLLMEEYIRSENNSVLWEGKMRDSGSGLGVLLFIVPVFVLFKYLIR